VNPKPQERFEAIYAAHYGDVRRYALRRAERELAEEGDRSACGLGSLGRLALRARPPGRRRSG
jgi:hypothetical protein